MAAFSTLLLAAATAASTVECDPTDPAKCTCDGVPIGPHTWKPPSWLVSNKTSIFDTSALLNGKLTPLSTLATLRGLVAGFRVGT